MRVRLNNQVIPHEKSNPCTPTSFCSREGEVKQDQQEPCLVSESWWFKKNQISNGHLLDWIIATTGKVKVIEEPCWRQSFQKRNNSYTWCLCFITRIPPKFFMFPNQNTSDISVNFNISLPVQLGGQITISCNGNKVNLTWNLWTLPLREGVNKSMAISGGGRGGRRGYWKSHTACLGS